MASIELPALVSQARQITLEKGLCVFSQGQQPEHFVVVTQGRITVFARSEEGKEVVLYRVNPGELCILTTACLIGHSNYPAEAVTDSETRVHVIPSADFERYLDESRSFRRFVFAGMGDRLARVTRRFEHMVLESVRHRLAHQILELVRSGPVIHATHEQLAVEIGSAREVISRNLKAFEAAGLLRLERGKITVIDPEGLKQVT
jgi:CRP/FNR family transcriptional regulator